MTTGTSIAGQDLLLKLKKSVEDFDTARYSADEEAKTTLWQLALQVVRDARKMTNAG